MIKAFEGSDMKVPAKVGSIVTALHDSKIITDYIFGGCRMANVKNSCGMYLAGGIVGYATGGNDLSGDVGSEMAGAGTYVVLDSNVVVVADVVAGSDGYYHCPEEGRTQYYDDRELFDTYTSVSYDPYNEYVGFLRPTHNNTNVYIRGGTVLGVVVGGGLAADVGFDDQVLPKIDRGGNKGDTIDDEVMTLVSDELYNGYNRGEVRVTVRGGNLKGNVYGGGFSSSVYGLSHVHISDMKSIGGAYSTDTNRAHIEGAVFAGNAVTGRIVARNPYRNVDGTVATDFAASDGTPLNKLKSDGSGKYENDYSAYVLVDGTPYIHHLYGSGDGAYDYDGTHPELSPVSTCDWEDKMPSQESAFLDIHTSAGAKIDTVFGGGNGVSVDDKVVVLLNCVSSTTEENTNDVDAIFGGNNLDDISVVPEVRLRNGIVGDVYGGSNNGSNTGMVDYITDACGNAIHGVSSYVLVEDPTVTITGNVYGGCNSGDVSGMAYVRVSNTSPSGVAYVFGGNNISGTVKGNTFVDITGGIVHHVYGGSNGHYDYDEVNYNEYDVYEYNSVHSPATLIRSATFGPPDVDSTDVHIHGGQVTYDVFGGGRMGECRATHVEIDDRTCGRPADDSDPEHPIAADGGAILLGTIYGGGEGDAENLNNTRRGNVTEATYVDLFHATNLSSAKAYGGGKGGDVFNTNITAYDTWDKSFDALYGGCWGSNVHGIANITINSDPSHLRAGEYNVASLFGGNDFTGNVYKSVITINSGKFNNVYGGSNGDYPHSDYTSAPYIGTDSLRRPNSQYIELTFNDGTVDSNLYGGGKFGTSFCFAKNPDGSDFLDSNNHKMPDTTLAYNESHSNPLDYSYIITNIHGGLFNNDVYGGARGSKTNTDNLVYGLKVVNMDGGHVYKSLYGGSESVHDGYAAECVDKNETTARPSSIVNLTGGTVDNNLYGAGYLGLVHGSIYVNIGQDAIDSCLAYKQAYKAGGVGSAAGAYSIFKPGAVGGLSPELNKNEVFLNRSIYAGANWGLGGGSADFTGQGFYGGESKIRIDGKGYNTSNNELSTEPDMNIAKSVFCSGTSVEGGDITGGRIIDVWNYGSIANCQPTRKLESIQRGDTLWFHNTALELTGAIDAESAYQSIPYSIKNIYSTIFRGYNVLEFDAIVENVPGLIFYEEPLLADGSLEVVPIQNLRNHVGAGSCADTATTCSNLKVVDPEISGKQHTLLILNNGIEFDVARINPYSPGSVAGFGYVYTPAGYSSTIRATATAQYGYSYITPGYFDWDSWLGGFASPCDTTNKYTADRGLVDWHDYANEEERLKSEHPYTNYDGEGYGAYRIWKVGNGTRLRETTILAHAIPDSLDQNVSIRTHGNANMAIAEASIKMPATSTGHYYKLASGITLSSENEVVNLIDSAFMPTQDFATMKTLYTSGGTVDTTPGNPPTYGKFLSVELDNTGIATGVSEIIEHPTNTFGLVMTPGDYFDYDGEFTEYYSLRDTSNFRMPAIAPPISKLFVLSGNSHVTSNDYYYTPKVQEGTALTPTLKFYLTYNTNFTTAFLGTVEFTLDEYIDVKKRNAEGYLVKEDGTQIAGENDAFLSGYSEADVVWVPKNLNSPIQMKVYISTIIEEFKPINTEVLAMYNAGRTNTFTRKVVLPATLEEDRDLYLTSASWVPTDSVGQDSVKSHMFYLTDSENSITGAAEGVSNLFALNIRPTEDISNEMASNLGWSRINESDINVYDLKGVVGEGHTAPSRYSDSTLNVPYSADTINFVSENSHGIRIGTLDGRGTAVLDVQLTFDGERFYPDIKGKGYVGKLVLNLSSRKGEAEKKFSLTVNVKTRDQADTIYLATADSVKRGGFTLKPYRVNSDYLAALPGNPSLAATLIGKTPNAYVQSFQEALSTKVYQEGDVLCIVDTMKIGNHQNISIHGGTGPAIEVIGYDGHHTQMWGERGVYRGPMIQVKNDGTKFTATNIAFHGGAGSIIMDLTSNRPASLQDDSIQKFGDYALYPDTNRVFAPIFQILDSGEVVLNGGTLVRYNWNAYGSEEGQLTGGLPTYSRNMGAISLTSGGTLTLKNNVSIDHNMSHTFDGDNRNLVGSSYEPLRPYNGAVYIDGGHLVLPQSNEATAVDITNNWLVDPRIHTAPAGTLQWWKDKTIGTGENERLVRWEFDDDAVENWQKSNVLLTRKAGADDMHDLQSDVITITGNVAPATRIGIRKWFPGPTERDTIRVVDCGGSNLTVMAKAVENENFISDDDHNVFYSANVNNNFIYLQRCATFRHQIATGAGNRLATGETAGDVLDYIPDQSTTCPVGGDAIIYRVQGGFFPYQYTWLDTTTPASPVLVRDVSTVYGNNFVNADLEEGNYNSYNASVADTLFTPRLDVVRDGNQTYLLKVVATDEAGCKLEKSLKLHYKMYDSGTDGDYTAFTKVSVGEDGTEGWTDTNSYDTDDTITAVGKRLFKGVHITPYVWADRSQGTIRALVHYENGGGSEPPYDTVIYTTDATNPHHDLESQIFCEGDVITLYTKPREAETATSKFIMWDFDPYYSNPAKFVVPSDDEDVVAYYGPVNYWKEHITDETEATAAYSTSYYYSRPTDKGYVTTYEGDVHIYNEEGLAWLISVMNGLNGQQIRQFRFNTIYLHDKDGGYDMKEYLWSPMATAQHKFRGRFIGVGSSDTATVPLAGSRVVVKNIIINEPDMNNVAFFAHLDTALVSGIELQGVLARGSQYVGGLVARSHGSEYDNVAITTNGFTNAEDPTSGEARPGVATTSILTTRYVSGGLIAESNGDKIDNSRSWVKYVGDAVYSGGVVGYGISTTITNDGPVRNDVRMSGLYVGGVAGYLEGEPPVEPQGLARLFTKRKAANPSMVANNYVEVINRDLPQNIGGLVGYAENTVMENNYVFGNVSGSMSAGGVAAVMSNNAQADKNYYADGSSTEPVGYADGNASVTNSSEFKGSGNQVLLANPVYGVNNLTRVLNKYVREKNAEGGHYKTWRSDLEATNHGYPLYGEPDIIPVSGFQTIEGCEAVVVNGVTYTHDSTFTVRFIDSVEMVDSLLTATIRLHYGTHTSISDSAHMDEDYSGYGFTLSVEEIRMLNLTIDAEGHASIILNDTLSTAFGCDSVVSLTLTFTDYGTSPAVESTTVLVYPNPTTNVVNIEAEKMSHVEVYDNEGRRLQDYDAYDSNKITIDMRSYVSGVYFVRVHTPENVVIQKVVKER